MSEDRKLWREALAEADTLERFNHWALPTAREKRGEFARMVAAEALKRRYTYIGTKATGCYVDVTPEEYAAVMAELNRRDRNKYSKSLFKALRATPIKYVQAAWEAWVFKGSAADELGALMIADFRKRKDNKFIYEYDMVPRTLYDRLFDKDCASTLESIHRMFADQGPTELRDWREAK